jgi:hypothetical protein
MFFGGGSSQGACPGGGAHDSSQSGHYSVPFDSDQLVTLGMQGMTAASTSITSTENTALQATTRALAGGFSGLSGTDQSAGGGYGISGWSTNGPGVYGQTGVQGQRQSSRLAGVYGVNEGDGGTGVWGHAVDTANGNGVYGDGGVGVWGAGTIGVYSDGNCQVTGTLSKSGGSFKIDHPLDPANKYLSHSFVESPDMKNIYDGVVVLDAHGGATVALPAWFESLNRDFRYQLTPIGGPAPDLHIANEICCGRFSIAGGQAGQKVSWTVTGIRQDHWANAHRIPVEEDKPSDDRGRYLHPELFGDGAEPITLLATTRNKSAQPRHVDA